MAPVILLDPESDHKPVVEETHRHVVYGKNFIFNPDTNEWEWDGTTYHYRLNTTRQFMTSIDNRFNTDIKAVAEIWHNVLTQPQRDWWKAVNADRDGARPAMRKGTINGWNLFAMYALAIVHFPPMPDFDWTVHEGWGMDSITFDSADSATQHLIFTRVHSVLPDAGARDFLFVHQVDPLHVDRRDADRRTFLIGYHEVENESDLIEEFTVDAVYLFNSGDTVQVLVREHVAGLCVNNTLLTCTAT